MSFAMLCCVGVWFGFIRSALPLAVSTCTWHRMHCIVVRGDAWPMLFSACNTH